MEYLVTMTTHVPDGTPEQAVADVRAREAAHSAELAARGSLLRLWRPPLQPGEWRTLGLFAAADETELEAVLSSMPLRVWRSDQVTPLSPHPNDPVPAPLPGPPEFFATFTVAFPEGTPAQVRDDAFAGEARRARELGAQGHLLRLWRLPPGGPGALGLWRARDAAEMARIIKTLPLDPWMTTDVTPLTLHPNDPLTADREVGRRRALARRIFNTEYFHVIRIVILHNKIILRVSAAGSASAASSATRMRHLAAPGHRDRGRRATGQVSLVLGPMAAGSGT